MPAKKIFVLNGHPGTKSLSHLFAETYAAAATQAGFDVRLTHLADLSFDMDYGEGGYGNPKPLEPQIETVLEQLEWADHVVLSTPMWWGGIPGKLKGLFDRVLLPGRTFDTRNPTKLGLPAPVLTGKTGRMILTSDSPRWFLRLAYGDAMIRQLRGQIFGFIGIKPARLTYFSGTSHPKEGAIGRWAETVRQIGAQGA